MEKIRRSALDRAIEESLFKWPFLEGKLRYSRESRSIALSLDKQNYFKDFTPRTERRTIVAWIARCIKNERELEKINDEAYKNVIQDKLL